MAEQTEREHLEARTLKQADGCWLWQGPLDRDGYGLRSSRAYEKQIVRAHRRMYELVIGQIPDDLPLDHLCRVRRCVNPDHLEPVTMRENLMRSPVAPAAVNTRKTHCIHGHLFSHGNTYVTSDGRRQCRTCLRDRNRARRQRARCAA
jgi:HNH endonuclease